MLFLVALLLLVSSGHGAYNVSLDDGDPQITYAGVWTVFTGSHDPTAGDYFGGSIHATVNNGSSARLAFTGSAIYYYGDLDTVNHGLTTITFGGKDTVISTSTSSGYQRQAVLFQRTGLENTTHGLIITQSDRDGLYTTIDRIIYTVEDPSPSPSPSPSSSTTNTNSLPSGSKAAIALGSVIGVMLLLGLLWVSYRRLHPHIPPAGSGLENPYIQPDAQAPVQPTNISLMQSFPESAPIASTSRAPPPRYTDDVLV